MATIAMLVGVEQGAFISSQLEALCDITIN
jgi:hypothetical protein